MASDSTIATRASILPDTKGKRLRCSSAADLLDHQASDEMTFLGYATSPPSKRRKADYGMQKTERAAEQAEQVEQIEHQYLTMRANVSLLVAALSSIGKPLNHHPSIGPIPENKPIQPTRLAQIEGGRGEEGRDRKQGLTRKRAQSLPSHFAPHAIACLDPRNRNASPLSSTSTSATTTSIPTTTQTSPKPTQNNSTQNPNPPSNDGVDKSSVIPRKSWSVPKFQYTEADIEVVGIIGEGLHAVVVRILCGGQSFACKIHKYMDADVYPGKYPRPNGQFVRESRAFTATRSLQQLATPLQPQIVPRCHGYVEFTRTSYKMLQLRYENFAIQEDPEEDFVDVVHLPRYFRNAPPHRCVLRGLVLDEIPYRPWTSPDLVQSSPLFESGRRGLEELHKHGVVHGDVCNIQNALIVKSVVTGREEIMWIDFSLAWDMRMDPEKFERMVKVDFICWDRHFRKDF